MTVYDRNHRALLPTTLLVQTEQSIYYVCVSVCPDSVQQFSNYMGST